MQTSPAIITDSQPKEFTIARLSENNIADLARLHSEVYNVPPREKYFRAKYNTSYTGVEYAGYIAYNKQDLPVAYYGVIPCFLRYGDEVMLAAQSADTMTHPRHRYKGMFVELSLMCFELCRQLGIRLIFGFPNENSYHGAVNKLGWRLIGRMDCFTIHCKTSWLRKMPAKIPLLKNRHKRFVQNLIRKNSEPLNGIACSFVTEGFAGVDRTEAYLNYKQYNPSSVIKIGEASIWISTRHGFMIGDLEGVNKENFENLMSQLQKIAEKTCVSEIRFHCSGGTQLHDLFSQSYPATPSFPALYQDFGSQIPPDKIRFSLADIDIF
jgi:hypothetical protein